MQNYRILIAEDDAETATLLQKIFEAEGYVVDVATDGEQALDAMKEFKPDLTFLDVNMPKKSGIDVCRASREFTNSPVLMLTALDDEKTEDAGLNAGALHFIHKPVRRKGLLTRVRQELESATEDLRHGNLLINRRKRIVMVEEAGLELTTKEYDALLLLAESEGAVVARELFFDKLYNMEYDGVNRTVDNLIVRLRRKLQANNASVEIKTITGKGYLYTRLELL